MSGGPSRSRCRRAQRAHRSHSSARTVFDPRLRDHGEVPVDESRRGRRLDPREPTASVTVRGTSMGFSRVRRPQPRFVDSRFSDLDTADASPSDGRDSGPVPTSPTTFRVRSFVSPSSPLVRSRWASSSPLTCSSRRSAARAATAERRDPARGRSRLGRRRLSRRRDRDALHRPSRRAKASASSASTRAPICSPDPRGARHRPSTPSSPRHRLRPDPSLVQRRPRARSQPTLPRGRLRRSRATRPASSASGISATRTPTRHRTLRASTISGDTSTPTPISTTHEREGGHDLQDQWQVRSTARTANT